MRLFTASHTSAVARNGNEVGAHEISKNRKRPGVRERDGLCGALATSRGCSLVLGMSDEYLCFGDAVYLLDDITGSCAMAQGFDEDVNVVITKADSKRQPGAFTNVAVYTVWQSLTTHAAQDLRKARDEFAGGGATTRRGNEAMARLEQAARKEQVRNQDEFELNKGREVRYGMAIVLRHEGSGKFVAVSAQSSDHDKDARKVVVSDEIGPEMFLRLMPQLERVHSEGERINHFDPVQFESVSDPRLKLHISDKIGGATCEVLSLIHI